MSVLQAAATSCVSFAIGDCISQTLIKKRTVYDAERTIRFALVGGVIHGPYFRYCFGRLDKVFPTKTIPSVLKKSFAAQTIVFPPYLAAFFTSSALLEGKSLTEAIQRVRSSLWPTFLAGTLVWPATNTFQLMFIPVTYRILWLNAVGIGWNSYMSHANLKAAKDVTARNLQNGITVQQ